MRKPDMAGEARDSINYPTLLYWDDFGNLCILGVEEIVRIRTPTREWPKVYTVGDAINLLVRAVEAL